MKVIDLLVLISEGEEVPKKVLVFNKIYEYQETKYKKNYYSKKYNDYLFEFNECSNDIKDLLNYEIEIIEDKPKKIEKIPILILGETENNKYAYDVTQIRADIDVLARQLNIITEKQCEIIDFLNNMEE